MGFNSAFKGLIELALRL